MGPHPCLTEGAAGPLSCQRAVLGTLLAVATPAEAVPLLGFRSAITGMGRRDYRLEGCSAVLSAGFAGACQARLRPGDLITAGCSPELRRRLGAVDGALQTIDHVASPTEKAALGQAGVAAVDMETYWLAQAASAASLPFLAVRVIIDRAHDPAVGPRTAGHYVQAAVRLRRCVALALRWWP